MRYNKENNPTCGFTAEDGVGIQKQGLTKDKKIS